MWNIAMARQQLCRYCPMGELCWFVSTAMRWSGKCWRSRQGQRLILLRAASACAAREMEEEIGYHAGKLEKLLTTATTGAFCNECIDVYLAMDLQKTVQHLDEEEILNVECWELEDLCQMIFSGELIDAKTIAAILAYKVYKNKRVGI